MVHARVTGIAIDCPDAEALCAFYTGLLGIERSAPDAFMIGSGAGSGNGSRGIEVWFQTVENYVAPTWPTQERGQQIHFDLECDDRPAAIASARELGATVADKNPGGKFTVMLDPAGHPFCLCDPGHDD